MIIVKKIQNPNIFFTFTKKYYHCHIYHDHQCRFTRVLAEKHKNTSTCTKKWYFLINEFQKNTIFTPIFEKTVFFDQRISEKYHFYPYFCIFFVLFWRIYPINHIYIYTGEKNKKIKQKKQKNRKTEKNLYI